MRMPNFSRAGNVIKGGAQGAGKYALNKLIDGLQEPGMTPEQYQELLDKDIDEIVNELED